MSANDERARMVEDWNNILKKGVLGVLGVKSRDDDVLFLH